MPWNGSGTFSRIYSWQIDYANGIDVRADRMDTDSDDIAAGISNCLAKDGQTSPIADISWGGFKLTNLAAGAASGDAVNYGQVFTNPVFTNPAALSDPPSGSNDQSLVTSAWVRANFNASSNTNAVVQVLAFQTY